MLKNASIVNTLMDEIRFSKSKLFVPESHSFRVVLRGTKTFDYNLNLLMSARTKHVVHAVRALSLFL